MKPVCEAFQNRLLTQLGWKKGQTNPWVENAPNGEGFTVKVDPNESGLGVTFRSPLDDDSVVEVFLHNTMTGSVRSRSAKPIVCPRLRGGEHSLVAVVRAVQLEYNAHERSRLMNLDGKREKKARDDRFARATRGFAKDWTRQNQYGSPYFMKTGITAQVSENSVNKNLCTYTTTITVANATPEQMDRIAEILNTFPTIKEGE